MPAARHTTFYPVLRRTHDNRFVQQMVVQVKLEIGQIDDVYEQEADWMADVVMRMPIPVRLCPKEQLLQDRITDPGSGSGAGSEGSYQPLERKRSASY